MSTRALIAEIRLSGVELWAEGDELHYAGPKEAVTPELVERMRHHKSKLIRSLEAERRKLEQAGRHGLKIRWSEYLRWIKIHDPTTGEWHEVKASECLPGMVETANRYRKRGGAA